MLGNLSNSWCQLLRNSCLSAKWVVNHFAGDMKICRPLVWLPHSMSTNNLNSPEVPTMLCHLLIRCEVGGNSLRQMSCMFNILSEFFILQIFCGSKSWYALAAWVTRHYMWSDQSGSRSCYPKKLWNCHKVWQRQKCAQCTMKSQENLLKSYLTLQSCHRKSCCGTVLWYNILVLFKPKNFQKLQNYWI